MLGFGKKKKKDKDDESGKDLKKEKAADPPEPEEELEEETEDDDSSKKKKKKKKRAKKGGKKLPIKLIIILLLVLTALGASGFLVYKLYFTSSDPMAPEARYKKVQIGHITLPDEMLEFTFTHFRELYFSMIEFNTEINLLDSEIQRIDAVAKKYPEQKAIADKEIKFWEKVKTSLKKPFAKIEDAVRKLYVQFEVNKEQGTVQISEKNPELTQLAKEALKVSDESTRKLKQKEAPPEGLVNGIVYKIKNIF